MVKRSLTPEQREQHNAAERERYHTRPYSAFSEEEKEAHRASVRRWRQANLEKYRARANEKQKEYYRKNAEKRRQYALDYRKSLSPEERHRRERQNKLITKYRIRPEWYEQTLAAQNNACAICLSPFAGQHSNRNYEDIDHDHRTQKVRGILCRGCNMAIHKMDKDIAWAEKAVAYLKAHVAP